MKPTQLTLAPALTLALALCATGLPAAAIVGGQPTNNFKAVGVGVQVAPDWVMTVGHSGFDVGTTYENGYGVRTVAAVFVPGTAPFPADDFMLLQLVPQAGTESLVFPLVGSHFYQPGTFRPLDVTIVSPANHSPRGVGLTRVQEAVPFYDEDGPGPLPAVAVNWLVSDDTQVRVQGGDSGGGLFQTHLRDAGVLIGLASAALIDDTGNAAGSAFVQPAAYRSWIDGVMSAHGVDTDLRLWASAVPEPATWLLGLAGAAWLAARRRP